MRAVRIACIGSLASIVLAIAVIVLRMVMLSSVEDGISGAMLDPAITIFHLVVFPLAFSILVLRFPAELLVAARGSKPLLITSIMIVVILGVIAVSYTALDARRAVCNRLSVPEAYAGNDLRQTLQKIRREQILIWETARERDGSNPPPALAAASTSAAPTCDAVYGHKVGRIADAQTAKLRDAYCTALGKPAKGPGCEYVAAASVWAMVTALGSIAAALLGATLLSIFALHFVAGMALSSRSAAGLFTVITLLFTWLPLAAVSQYYASFGMLDVQDSVAGIVVATGLALALIVWLILKAEKTLRTVIMAIVGAGAVVISTLAGLKVAVVQQVLQAILALDGPSRALIYLFVVLFVAAMAFAELRVPFPARDKGEPDPH